MNRKIVLTSFFILLVANNAVWLSTFKSSLSEADSHAELEIDIREKIIAEMAEFIYFQNRGASKEELKEFLKEGFDPEFIEDEGQWVYFRSLKFEYKEGKLSKVYW